MALECILFQCRRVSPEFHIGELFIRKGLDLRKFGDLQPAPDMNFIVTQSIGKGGEDLIGIRRHQAFDRSIEHRIQTVLDCAPLPKILMQDNRCHWFISALGINDSAKICIH
jgi:hypothetical protein